MDKNSLTAPPEGNCCLQTLSVERQPVENSLSGFLGNLFDTSSYPARWNCGEWTPIEGWLHIVSDVGIFLAYFAIPAALIYFLFKRKDTPFNGLLFLFAAFILFCGAGHLLEAVIFYHPLYRLSGVLKLATAIVSCITSVVLLKQIPKFLEFPHLATKNELLQKADQAKTEFLANMSHEIRTPMTAILGYADLLHEDLKRNPGSAQQSEAIEAIQRNGLHLFELINDILDLSKIEAGKFTVELSQCDPLEVTREVITLLCGRAAEKGIALEIRPEGPLPESIATDHMRLRQVLINIVGNAIKFTETGSVCVALRLDQSVSGSPKIVFDVIDTGIGIPQNTLKQLFTPFTQADSSTTRKFGGTGLGLTISRRIAVALGGDISVESAPGQGSTFTVTLATGSIEEIPLIDHSTEINVTQRETSPAPSPSRTNTVELPYRILVVEDGIDNQRLIRFILEKVGATVDLAENGQIAVERISEASQREDLYDVILMDMQMPIMDGYEATRQLREQGYAGPIVALTAHAMETDRQKCIDAGCDDYLRKPIDRTVLLETIQKYATIDTSAEQPAFATPATTP